MQVMKGQSGRKKLAQPVNKNEGAHRDQLLRERVGRSETPSSTTPPVHHAFTREGGQEDGELERF